LRYAHNGVDGVGDALSFLVSSEHDQHCVVARSRGVATNLSISKPLKSTVASIPQAAFDRRGGRFTDRGRGVEVKRESSKKWLGEAERGPRRRGERSPRPGDVRSKHTQPMSGAKGS